MLGKSIYIYFFALLVESVAKVWDVFSQMPVSVTMSVSCPYSVPLAALQHYLYCPRQCALIHLECCWEENQFTAEGKVFHERVDSGMTENRGRKRVLRSLHISSVQWGIHGIADVVEAVYVQKGSGVVSMTPVEYKVGKPKPHRADEVQVCAQALCLEEMFEIKVPFGFLFYGKNQRRLKVSFDEELRFLTARVIRDAREVLTGMVTPLPFYSKNCKSCSLVNDCLPDVCREHRQTMKARVDDVFEDSLGASEADDL